MKRGSSECNLWLSGFAKEEELRTIFGIEGIGIGERGLKFKG